MQENQSWSNLLNMMSLAHWPRSVRFDWQSRAPVTDRDTRVRRRAAKQTTVRLLPPTTPAPVGRSVNRTGTKSRVSRHAAPDMRRIAVFLPQSYGISGEAARL